MVVKRAERQGGDADVDAGRRRMYPYRRSALIITRMCGVLRCGAGGLHVVKFQTL